VVFNDGPVVLRSKCQMICQMPRCARSQTMCLRRTCATFIRLCSGRSLFSLCNVYGVLLATGELEPRAGSVHTFLQILALCTIVARHMMWACWLPVAWSGRWAVVSNPK
jgi:hypothetical protein